MVLSGTHGGKRLTGNALRNAVKTHEAWNFTQIDKDPVTGKTIYTCLVCGKLAKDRGNVIRHYVVKHAEPTHNPCDQCGRDFRNRYDLLMHYSKPGVGYQRCRKPECP